MPHKLLNAEEDFKRNFEQVKATVNWVKKYISEQKMTMDAVIYQGFSRMIERTEAAMTSHIMEVGLKLDNY
jgi:hypothetical protein